MWNEVEVDWFSVVMWFGTLSSLSLRMRTCGLVCPLFVAETTWFGIPNFVTWKENGWDMVLKTMKYVTAMVYRWVFRW